MVSAKPYKHLTLEGTRTGLVVRFASANIFVADEIQAIGRELLRAADVAISIDMTLFLSFQGVDDMSSALLGKIVLLNKKIKSHGITMRLTDMSPTIKEVFRRTFGNDGSAFR